MHTKIKSISFFLLLSAFLLFQTSPIYSQTDQYEEIVGTWDLTVIIEGFEEYSTFVFELRNDTLTGMWYGDYGPLSISNVSFTQDSLRGVIVIEEAGQEITIISVVTNGSMKGRGLSQMSELFPFTATKREKDFRRNYYYLLYDFK